MRAHLVIAVLFVVGGLVSILALPLPGTGDVGVYRIWTYHASLLGPVRVYGIGAHPPSWRQLTSDRIQRDGEHEPARPSLNRLWLTFDGKTAEAGYPPLAIATLALVGHVYRWFFPSFPATTALTVAIKLPALFATLGLSIIILLAAPQLVGTAGARRAALLFWLSPAVILDGVVLGYLDSLFALPAVAALLAAVRGSPAVAGVLLMLACLTKPQAVLIMPAVALAVVNTGPRPWRALARASGAAAVTASVCLAPFIIEGAFGALTWAVARLLTGGQLTGNAANLWLLVNYAGDVVHNARSLPIASAISQPVSSGVTAIEFFAHLGLRRSTSSVVSLALGASAAVCAAGVWATCRARFASSLPCLAALAAFTVHAFAVLWVQVHENHLYLAIPLLAIAAATRPAYRPIFAAVSVIMSLNLYLFYGLGIDSYSIPFEATFIDTRVVLAVLNCAALVWHARVFSRDTAEPQHALGAWIAEASI